MYLYIYICICISFFFYCHISRYKNIFFNCTFILLLFIIIILYIYVFYFIYYLNKVYFTGGWRTNKNSWAFGKPLNGEINSYLAVWGKRTMSGERTVEQPGNGDWTRKNLWQQTMNNVPLEFFFHGYNHNDVITRRWYILNEYLFIHNRGTAYRPAKWELLWPYGLIPADGFKYLIMIAFVTFNSGSNIHACW